MYFRLWCCTGCQMKASAILLAGALVAHATPYGFCMFDMLCVYVCMRVCALRGARVCVACVN